MIELAIEGMSPEEWQAAASAALADGSLLAGLDRLLRRAGLLSEGLTLQGRLVGAQLRVRVVPAPSGRRERETIA